MIPSSAQQPKLPMVAWPQRSTSAKGVKKRTSKSASPLPRASIMKAVSRAPFLEQFSAWCHLTALKHQALHACRVPSKDNVGEGVNLIDVNCLHYVYYSAAVPLLGSPPSLRRAPSLAYEQPGQPAPPPNSSLPYLFRLYRHVSRRMIFLRLLKHVVVHSGPPCQPLLEELLGLRREQSVREDILFLSI